MNVANTRNLAAPPGRSNTRPSRFARQTNILIPSEHITIAAGEQTHRTDKCHLSELNHLPAQMAVKVDGGYCQMELNLNLFSLDSV